jgi:glutamate/tyrosine decarboxylase-like PLP-dependent enzyme
MTIPTQNIDKTALLDELEALKHADLDWQSGKTYGYTYDAGPEVAEVAKRAFTSFMTENALDPTSFPSLLRLENEVVGMALGHLSAPADAAGSFTSGGTESIILAVKAAREHARATRPEITEPEMVLPVTAHAAFHKAACYLGVKLVVVDVDPETFRADPELMAAAITDNTILLVASATSYAHGVVDPIEAIGAIAKERDLLFHVDGCIGAFLLPYLRRLGADIPAFDFTVDGVTSISMDLHKYAYCPKGASIVAYRDKSLRAHQIYSCSSWSGYSVVNPTIQSSKSGGPLAAAWAVLRFIGDAGYLDLADKLHASCRRILDGLATIPELRVLGEPEMSLIAFTSDEVNVFDVVDEMKERGWYVQAQLSCRTSPANIHLSVTPGNVEHTNGLIEALRESVAAAKEIPPEPLPDHVVEMIRALTPEVLTPELMPQILGMAGIEDNALPGRMARVNDLLDELSDPVSDALLSGFLNELFRAERAVAVEAARAA